MRATTRERLTADPHRSLVHTPSAETPGAIIIDQTGVHPLPAEAVWALPSPDTVAGLASPYRDGVQILAVANSEHELAGLPITFQIAGQPHLYAGPCCLIAHDETEGTVALTLDEIFWLLRQIHVLGTTGEGPETSVVWLLALGEVA